MQINFEYCEKVRLEDIDHVKRELSSIDTQCHPCWLLFHRAALSAREDPINFLRTPFRAETTSTWQNLI